MSRLVALVALPAAVAVLSGGTPGALASGSACPSLNSPNELLLLGGSGQTAQLGRPFPAPFQVQLANTNGCPLSGDLAGTSVDFDAPGAGPSGTFTASGSREAIVGTDAQGVASAPSFVANDTAGGYAVDAHSDYGHIYFNLTNTAAGLPASIAVVGGSGQDASVDSPYAALFEARVTDAAGNPVQGAMVSFSVVPGATGAGGVFVGGQPVATTGADGIATSPPLQANDLPGGFTVVASVDGATAVAHFTLDNHATASSVAAVSPARMSAAVAMTFKRRLQARVVDAGGDAVEGASVVFAVQGATFSQGSASAAVLTGADGVATSPALVAGTTAGTFTATAAVSRAQSPVIFTLDVVAGAAATVTAGAASGESAATRHLFPVPLAVTVTDRYGNPVAGALVVFAAPARHASGRFGARRVVRVRTNANGIAVATRFRANGAPGGYVVTATVRGVPNHASFALVNEAP